MSAVVAPAVARVCTVEAQAMSWRLAIAEARRARWKYDNVTEWLATLVTAPRTPVGADVWVFTSDFQKVLLVKHPWRGWVAPGGKVESDEPPYMGARRELLEESGLVAQPDPIPAAAAVRRFHRDLPPTLSLSYAAVVGEEAPCRGEVGQPAAWTELRSGWPSYFADDQERLVRHAEWLERQRDLGARRRVSRP